MPKLGVGVRFDPWKHSELHKSPPRIRELAWHSQRKEDSSIPDWTEAYFLFIGIFLFLSGKGTAPYYE